MLLTTNVAQFAAGTVSPSLSSPAVSVLPMLLVMCLFRQVCDSAV